MALYAFDGTWKGPDENPDDDRDSDSNVRLFAEYYAACHKDANLVIHTNYVAGVGTRLGRSGKIIGGATGAGGRSRIDEMLDLCIEQIKEGDEVVDIVGFSRGAALALHFANQVEKLKLKDGSDVSIRFLGLWDVVPAFGLPGAYWDLVKDIDIGWDLDVPANVGLCAHAMARHERRQAFDVLRLDPLDLFANVKEVWFRGVHSDVGGGNGNIGLSSISLHWIMEQGKSCGIPFATAQMDEVKGQNNVSARVSKNSPFGEEIDRPFLEKDVLHGTAVKRLDVGESKLVQVDSRLVYDFSGIFVEAGQRYLIQPNPESKWTDQTISCDSTGWPSDLSRNRQLLSRLKEGILESKAVGLARRVRTANWFELCLSVGFDGRNVIPVGKNQFRDRPWTCEKSGALSFFANDALWPINKYDNNSGSVEVTVTRIA